MAQDVQTMSVALRKRNHRLESAPHPSLIDVLAPPGLIVLILTMLVAILGHFTAAR